MNVTGRGEFGKGKEVIHAFMASGGGISNDTHYHGESHVGLLERWAVIGPVSCHRDDLSGLPDCAVDDACGTETCLASASLHSPSLHAPMSRQGFGMTHTHFGANRICTVYTVQYSSKRSACYHVLLRNNFFISLSSL